MRQQQASMTKHMLNSHWCGCWATGAWEQSGRWTKYTIAAHKPPCIDPGSDQWQGGMGDATVETCQQEVALGKQWWRLAMWPIQHWVGQSRNNRHLSHVTAAPNSYHCSTSLSFEAPQDRWEKIKYWMWMKPSPSLSLTAGIQRFPINRQKGGGATPTEKSEEGVFWHTQLTY